MVIEQIYSRIAKEFSHTRSKNITWKGVTIFLKSLKKDDRVCFAGCGNGRNMEYLRGLRTTENIFGFDICEEFVDECTRKQLNVIKGDILDPPYEKNSFDVVLCIAVIHHLKTEEERISAIDNLIRLAKPGGRILIFVWAFEQPKDSKRNFTCQDNFVPFKLNDGSTNERFYHVYKDGELMQNVDYLNKTTTVNHYWEKGNWVIELTKNLTPHNIDINIRVQKKSQNTIQETLWS